MSQSAESIRRLSSVAGMILFGILLIYWTCRKSQAPVRLLFRWLLTLGVVIFFVTVISRAAHSGSLFPILGGLYLSGVCGLVLALTWLEPLGEWAAKVFVSLIDGATNPPDPVPIYSKARARQKQGKYPEAISEIRRELSRFPTDFEGQLLLAEILAENLKDLESAQSIVDQICFQPGRTANNTAFALYAMADWHLSIGKDKKAARQCLERIGELLPNTVHSLGAAQRISHLAEPTFELEPKRYVIKELAARENSYARSEPSTEAADTGNGQLEEYLEHLKHYPFDCEARERIAVIYADLYGRFDLAVEQLQEMIELPNQPMRNVVRWLNLLADIQIRLGADLLAVQATLHRIIDLDSHAAAATLARNRISRLKLEIKGKEKSQAVKIGSYEKNIGLKRSFPRQH